MSRIASPLRFAALAVLTACSATSTVDAPPAASADLDVAAYAWHAPGRPRSVLAAVEAWNDNVTKFAGLAATSPPGEARIAAIGNAVMHDVLNAFSRRYEPYAYTGLVSRPTSAEAAIATAVRDALVGAAGNPPSPAGPNFINQAYADYMNALGSGDEIARGVSLGHDVSAAILAKRVGDGSAGPPVVPFTSTGEPGKYRPTLMPSPDGLSGLQAIPYWGKVRPFVITSGDQFRAPPMYGAATVAAAVKTPRYLADYAEVKRLGGMVSERTQDQTDIGFFWIGSSVVAWSKVARTLAADRKLNAWRLARLMSHVTLSIADAYIVSFDSKYFYNFWRPVTAIRLGNLDPATPGDPTWQAASMLVPALGPTPPIPDYASGHAIAGAAAGGAILANISGPTPFSLETSTLPGKVRQFRSVMQAVQENADSRVYIGFHFRLATEVGVSQGLDVARYVTQHSLRKLDDD